MAEQITLQEIRDFKGKYPRQLWHLAGSEMWERFCFYGMRGMLVVFMVSELGLADKVANLQYGAIQAFVYAFTFIGGLFADKILGFQKSLFWGAAMMIAGGLVIAFSPHDLFYIGICFSIIGTGFFKPNISTMVGQLYPANDRRIDSAFTIFYMGINLGALFSPLVAGTLGDTGNIFDFKWGFLAASIGMMLSILTFELLKNKYLVHDDGTPVGMPKAKMDMKTILSILGSVAVIFFLMNFKSWFQTDFDLTGVLIYGAMVAMPIVIFSDKSLVHEEKQRISVIFILAFFVIFFWACFEQAGASLTLFADRQTDRHIGSWEMPASYFQSVNPIFIITLAPLFSMLWGWLGKKGWEPSSPLKMAMGLGLLALGYAVIAFGVHGMAPSAKISLWWLITLYGLHTMGELCLSPIGLSMVSKLAPIRLSSLLMGTWFLANAAANKFAGTLSALIPPSAEDLAKDASLKIPTFLGFQLDNLFSFFLVFIALSGSAAVVLVVIHKWLQKRMHGIN